MQTRRDFGKAVVGVGMFALAAGLSASAGALPPSHGVPAKEASTRAVTPGNDPRAIALLGQVEAATRVARTMTADFIYTVTSVKSQQYITGSVQMMKPNFARVHFSFMAKPAFPNLVASNGKTVYSFIPSSFRADRTFDDLPFDSQIGARNASGDLSGGGRIGTDPADASGANVHLWDAVPVQAFFGPRHAILSWVYADPDTLRYAGEETVNGVRYRVLANHFVGGNIAGGESSDFDQQLYIGPDNLIHGYVLEFTSGGRRGVQTAWLKNIKVNAPMSEADFAFAGAAGR